ncbi:MAG: hypothetical protein FRX49_03794 [Trebouxia sp. A1-2]|nr:MAG: hypothetical protein FRX49_03794 [Trebouxia sp. A1-2]
MAASWKSSAEGSGRRGEVWKAFRRQEIALSRPACRDKAKKALQAELLPFSHHRSTARPAAMRQSQLLHDICVHKCKNLDAETWAT